MRTYFPQSKSSSIEDEEEDNHESSCYYYYPDCKKDANCNCEICLASINATLDLIPNSSLTKFSSSKPNFQITPISFHSSILSTPKKSFHSRSIIPPSTPILKSSAKSNYVHKMEKKNKGQERYFSGIDILRVMAVLGFLFFADIVLSRVVSGVFQPSFSPDVVKRVGEKCHKIQDLNGKLRFLQNELGSFVHGKVSNCGFSDTSWEISQVLYLALFIRKSFLIC